MSISAEKELIQKASKDPAAFEALYEAYYQPIFNYLFRRTFNWELAQDLTSEVFLKAMQKLWQFRFRDIAFSSWLYRIATHLLIDYYRKGRKQILSLEKLLEQKGYEPAHYQTPHGDLLKAEEILQKYTDFQNLRQAMTKLSFEEQTILSLKFFEKKKIKEIAEITRKKQGTIKSIISRSLEKLRSLSR